ncbi:lasso peptide biosynthesis PqqD family chaperone [Frankia sp. CNm7]|uniref:Lasso peptide biosynthesis PqqD family chaperone n=1 Tax=Frankia nepalensis TaxID=1836974 RepID=A0A937RAR1_9ACTN|nr:lasso peptide biosynthesis PqqD family chaperone [Frankia nepalensis]MBL7496111.1 lasso peptide biosynthesis PqqD family chaperone [Frankia nepalensis]MBL7508950.1 lasso peptide biosynthesis PqqD family chaperone [Frankia nepalensis]MBL7516790.1 lasso peptide biosynthesis PqqD family chaperone [Frankia nepalensis]MBL7628728.1 lasso peptide biosynthesis PqqD family chaperone [Frankia nepalensis]
MLTLSQQVVSTDTDFGTALLDQRSGRYWTLNPTAALALRVLLDGGDQAHAARALLDEYDVAPATARADVDRLVDELSVAGLVTVSGRAAGTSRAGARTALDTRGAGTAKGTMRRLLDRRARGTTPRHRGNPRQEGSHRAGRREGG